MSCSRACRSIATTLLDTAAAKRRTTRQALAPRRIQCRSFFGIGEIVGVLANPGETLRQIRESKKMLEETREELALSKEREKITPPHTFKPLPGFFRREQEIKALERALSGIPAFTCLFGASSCGKTALLREVLANGNYHVLFFDLRIAGFADLSSLYFSLSMQMERFFLSLLDQDDRYKQFEKESWSFKHDRLAVEKRLENPDGHVKTADIAHLMEMLQSSLLNYWQFDPERMEPESEIAKTEENEKRSLKARSLDTSADSKENAAQHQQSDLAKTIPTDLKDEKADEQKRPPLKKKVPVLLLDEAHKLPALIKSDDAMKSLLDAMLVLTKQDRLIHVIHATSDGFYQHWLRQMNVLQHCLLLTIGDVCYDEARQFFMDRLLPDIPDRLRDKIDFDEIYDAFGGKLAHISDFVSDFINSDGTLPIKESSHYLQAYSLLNLQLVHAVPQTSPSEGNEASVNANGFAIYSAVPMPTSQDTGSFTAEELLGVLKALQASAIWELDYFKLCRQLGAAKVDSMVRGRLLELRWTPSLTIEGRRKERHLFTGPVVLPTTPVIRFAMQEVLKEYEAVTRSELPGLSSGFTTKGV